MQKTFLFIISVILLVNLTACGSKFLENDVKGVDGNDNPEKIISSSDETELIFNTGNIEVIKDLEGQEFVKQTEILPKKEYLKLIKNPRGYAKLWFEDNCGALILSSKNALLAHSLFEIWYPLKDRMRDSTLSTFETSYYPLPDILSTDLIISSVGDRIDDVFGDLYKQREAENMSDKAIMVDNKNNILISFTIDKEKIKIVKAIKLKSNIAPKELRIILGYNEDGVSKALLTDKDNNIYTMKVDSLELISQQDMEEWKVISGYHEKITADQKYYDDGNNKEIYCLYLYNEKENMLRKYDLLKDNIIYDLDIEQTPIKGSIIKVVSDCDLGIYVLTKDNGKYLMYTTNEERWHVFWENQKYDDGIEYGNIDDIWWFKVNEFHRFIAIYNSKSDDYPVKLNKDIYQNKVK